MSESSFSGELGDDLPKTNAGAFNFWDWLDTHFKLLTLLPAIILFLLLTVAPAVQLVRMAFYQIDFAGGAEVWTFAFGKNLDRLFSDAIYRASLVNTVIFVFLSTMIELLLGFGLALTVSNVTRGKGLFRAFMLLPILIPPVAIGNMWRLMYNPQFGIIHSILSVVGLGSIDLIGSPQTALLAVIIVDVWHWTPFVFLVLLAGYEALPQDVFDAAGIDGASFWQRLRYVIVPMMRPALVVAFMFRSVIAFKVFDEIFLLTSGGPGTSTEVLSLDVYQVFFNENQLGYGAMLAIITIAIICSYLAVFSLVRRRQKNFQW